MKVRGVECQECGDFVFSRVRHDMRYCSCKSSAADGGQEPQGYIRTLGPCVTKTREVPDATRSELFEDWNTGADKYGLIPPSSECPHDAADTIELSDGFAGCGACGAKLP